MSQTKKTEKESSGWNWLWWIIPPYAIYRIIRHGSMKWYIKVPVVLVLLFVLLLSIDLAFSPNRVEIAEAKQSVNVFLQEEVPGEKVRAVERMEQGISLKGDEKQQVVYYRALTDSGLYQLGLSSEDGKGLTVQHAEQLFPIRIDLLDSNDRTKAEVAIWLKQNEERVGKAKELVSSKESGMVQTVKTDKGTFEIKVGGQSVYEVSNIDKKEPLLKRENAPVLPDEVIDYLDKNEEKIGKLTKSLAYEMNSTVERYYFQTTTGSFLADLHDDGSIEFKKRNESEE